MNAAVVTAAQGARWLREGWRLFRVAPLAWLVLVFVYWLIMSVLSVLPVVGVMAATALVPAFAVGFMAASRAAQRGDSPGVELLFAGLRRGAGAQLVLGGLYFGALALILWATGLADDGALAGWMLHGKRPEEAMLRSDAFMHALLVAAAGYTPVMMLYWFAPVLVAWHGLAPAKALFFSFFGCLLNWRAFLCYGLAVALVALVIPFLVLGAVLLMAGRPLSVAAVMLLLAPLFLVLLATLLASFYASYRDVFGGPAQPPALG